VAAHHWRTFAERYKGISNEHVSSGLMNEPWMDDQSRYVEIVHALVGALREDRPGPTDRRRWRRPKGRHPSLAFSVHPEHARLLAQDGEPLHRRVGCAKTSSRASTNRPGR